MATLKLKNVSKSYDQQTIIENLNLSIDDGEMIVVVGPSGCGKSTLLRLIAGLEISTAGEILMDDKVINRLEPGERNIAMVFQNYALYPHMTVYKNMAYGLKNRKLSTTQILEKITKTAQMLGLENLLQRKPRQLSGGQRQRVAMGRAIVRDPLLYLFDEPLSNLDANLRGQMRMEIRKLQKKLKTTTLFVTHDQVEAMTLADRIVVMNQGRIEQIGTPAEIYHEPQSIFVGGFMGAPPMNFLQAALNNKGDAVVLNGGTVLPISEIKDKNYAARQIILGIRPESIIKASKEGADAFQLHVDMVEMLGAEKLIHGHFPGDSQSLTVRVPNKVSADIGELLTLGVMPDSLYVFDTMSKKRIE